MPDHEDRTDGQRAQPGRLRETEGERAASRAAARARIQQQHTWVDLQLRKAMERGDFDDLPGTGKPIRNLGSSHDPDWWVKQLIERERITGVLPAALQLRKDDAELDAKLDEHTAEGPVRQELEDFNARVMRARYAPQEGPPLVTMPRDVEAEVERWRARRVARHTGSGAPIRSEPPRRRRRWFRR